jgi:hypothetical protein
LHFCLLTRTAAWKCCERKVYRIVAARSSSGARRREWKKSAQEEEELCQPHSNSVAKENLFVHNS